MSTASDASSAAIPAPWAGVVVGRVRRFWIWKCIGSIAFSALFFPGYFALLKHPVFVVTTMPVLALDQAIPFQPSAIWIYGSLWLYLQLAPGLLKTKREILSYGVALTLMTLVAFAIFFFCPTRVPVFEIDWINHPGFSLLKKADAAGNACPSLHVAFAVFTGIWTHRLLRDLSAATPVIVLNWLWSFAIVYSTIATRQHVAIDVLAGALLGALTCLLQFRWLRLRA